MNEGGTGLATTVHRGNREAGLRDEALVNTEWNNAQKIGWTEGEAKAKEERVRKRQSRHH